MIKQAKTILTEQNFDSWDEDKLLFVTGEDTAIWIINLFDLMVWTKVTHSNDKARFAITTVLTWSLKSVMFSPTTTVST